MGVVTCEMRCASRSKRADLAAIVGAEVAAHALAKVGCLADVEHLIVARHGTGTRQELRGKPAVMRSFPAWGWAPMRGSAIEVVEAQHAEPGSALEQEVQQVGRCERIVEGAVRRPVVETKSRSQGAEAAIGHLVADQPPGQRQGVDDWVDDLGIAAASECGVDERHVEPDVVTDHDGVAEELDHRREVPPRSAGRAPTIDSVMPVSIVIIGGIARPGLTKRLQRAEELAGADLDHADLGDQVGVAIAAGGLDVEHAEGDVGQGSAEVIEGPLPAGCCAHRAKSSTNGCSKSRTSVRFGVIRLGTVGLVSAESAADVPDEALRSALEFAVGIAAAGAKLRPPLPFPAELKRFLRFHKLPPAALAQVRAAIEGDDDFRQRLAIGGDDGAGRRGRRVVAVASRWLGSRRSPTSLPEKVVDDEAALRREERRRRAAQEAAAQGARRGPERCAAELARERAAKAALAAEGDRLRAELDDLRQRLREAQRAEHATAQALAKAEAELVEAASTQRLEPRPAALPPPRRSIDTAVGTQACSRTRSSASADLVRLLTEALGELAPLDDVSATEPAPAVGAHAPAAAQADPAARRRVDRVRRGRRVPVCAARCDDLDRRLQRRQVGVAVTGSRPSARAVHRRRREPGQAVEHGHDHRVRRRRHRRRPCSHAAARCGSSTRLRASRPTTCCAPRCMPPMCRQPVVVVTNDRAIITDVVAAGANTVSSDDFLALLRR